MRKHFLLLFLMALLPLAGWADGPVDLSSVNAVRLTINPLVYVGDNITNITVTKVEVKATAEGDFEEISPANPAAAVDELEFVFYANTTAATPTTVKDAGDYYVAAKAKAGATTYFTANKEVPAAKRQLLNVAKRNLEITLFDAEKVYGDPDPVKLQWQAVSGLATGETENDVDLVQTLVRTNTAEAVSPTGYAYNMSTSTFESPNYVVTTTSTPKLVITKAPLSITYNSGDPFVLDYAQPIPTELPKFYVLNGTVKENNPAFAVTGLKGTDTYFGVFGENQITMTQDETDANATSVGVVRTGMDSYPIDYGTLTLDNYVIEDYPTNTMLIKQIDLSTNANVELTADDDQELEYNGNQQVANFTLKVKDDVKGINYTLQSGDLALLIKVWNPEANAGAGGFVEDVADPKHKNVGKYEITYNADPDGNFSGTFGETTEYTITPKKVWVSVISKEKVYDGAEFATSGAGLFSFNGLVAADKNTVFSDITVDYNDELPAHKAAKEDGYQVYANVANTSDLRRNYDVQALTVYGTYTITKRPVNVKGKALANIPYGTAVNYTADASTVAIELNGGEGVAENEGMITGDDDEIFGALTFTYGDDVKAGDKPTVADYTYTLVVKNDYDGNYTITPTAGGTYHVAGAGFTVIVKNVDYVYDKTTGYTAKFDVMKSITESIGDKLEYEVYATTDLETPIANPVNAGDYVIKVKKSSITAPLNYDIDNVEIIPGDLTISPRPLTITAKNQSLNVQAPESALEQYNINDNKVTFSYTGDATKSAVMEDDEIEYSLVFSDGIYAEGGDPVVKTLKDTYVEGSIINGGIVVSFDPAANKNYEITPVAGNILVIGAKTLVLDRTDVDLVSKINAAATASNHDYTVIFANRTMKAKKWYAMVLPFPTSVSVLSQKFGYAVVNVLKESQDSENKVQFKLHMETIPANTPFLVKVYNTDNAASVELPYGVDLADPSIKFTGMDISSVETDGLAPVEDAAKNQFIGTYKAQTWTETSDYRWILNSGAGEEGLFQKCDKDAGKCSALGAYLVTVGNLDSFAPAIFVEEPDGSTTAINTVTGEQTNFMNDAWYTLNGVKLNGMPTQKGVYINNGKKIVIK